MGFSYRKSFKVAPGVRMTLSKSGVGYSVGRNGMRVTKLARGGVQGTVGLPGSGLSYRTKVHRSGKASRRTSLDTAVTSLNLAASRRAAVAVPMPRRTKTARMLAVVGFLASVIGIVVLPLLLLALPCVLTGFVWMLVNLRHDRRWWRARMAAKAAALVELQAGSNAATG